MSYRCILADPPWAYDQPLQMKDGVKRSSRSRYRTMTVQEICDLYTPSVINGPGNTRWKRKYGALAKFDIDDIALLGLWITAPLLLEGIHERVCDAWGFTPKQIVPWIKGRLTIGTVKRGVIDSDGRDNGKVVGGDDRDFAELVIQPGMGALTRGCVEYLILATRGKYTSLVQSHSENGLLLAEEDAVIVAPKRAHSQKPDQQYDLLERLFPGPYLELFATRPRDGWTSWGDEMPPAAREDEPPLPLDPPTGSGSVRRRIASKGNVQDADK